MYSLTLSLPSCHFKTTNKYVKFEILKHFLFLFHITRVKGFPSKCTVLKVICYRMGKYTVCGHVHAFFSPEIVQDVAVKGLMGIPSKEASQVLSTEME